jgi:hypothetical protein
MKPRRITPSIVFLCLQFVYSLLRAQIERPAAIEPPKQATMPSTTILQGQGAAILGDQSGSNDAVAAQSGTSGWQNLEVQSAASALPGVTIIPILDDEYRFCRTGEILRLHHLYKGADAVSNCFMSPVTGEIAANFRMSNGSIPNVRFYRDLTPQESSALIKNPSSYPKISARLAGACEDVAVGDGAMRQVPYNSCDFGSTLLTVEAGNLYYLIAEPLKADGAIDRLESMNWCNCGSPPTPTPRHGPNPSATFCSGPQFDRGQAPIGVVKETIYLTVSVPTAGPFKISVDADFAGSIVIVQPGDSSGASSVTLALGQFEEPCSVALTLPGLTPCTPLIVAISLPTSSARHLQLQWAPVTN